MITFYGYKKCGTCRKAEQYLQKSNMEYKFVDITENPPSSSILKKVAQQASVETRKLFNTSGIQYRELNIKQKLPTLSDNDMCTMLAANGRLIKRPIITDGQRATVGFNEQVFKNTWR